MPTGSLIASGLGPGSGLQGLGLGLVSLNQQQLSQVLGYPLLSEELIPCLGEASAPTWVKYSQVRMPGLKCQFLYLLVL